MNGVDRGFSGDVGDPAAVGRIGLVSGRAHGRASVFEAAEIGSCIEKQEYEAELPGLRTSLINAQYDLREADFPGTHRARR